MTLLKKGPPYPTASHPACKQGSLSLPAFQVVRCSKSSPCFHNLPGLTHRFPWLQTQVIPAGKLTSTRIITALWCYSQQCPLLFAVGLWTKAGHETKYSLLMLCKENCIHLWPPFLLKHHRNRLEKMPTEFKVFFSFQITERIIILFVVINSQEEVQGKYVVCVLFFLWNLLDVVR